MQQKKVPMRMCVGCRQMKPKKQLLRVVRSAEGHVNIDKTGKAHGRGAYICPFENCLENAIRTRAFERTFESKLDASVIECLKKEIVSDESE